MYSCLFYECLIINSFSTKTHSHTDIIYYIVNKINNYLILLIKKFLYFSIDKYILICYNSKVVDRRGVAQLVAHTSGGRDAAGSSPVTPTILSVPVGYELSFRTLFFYSSV